MTSNLLLIEVKTFPRTFHFNKSCSFFIRVDKLFGYAWHRLTHLKPLLNIAIHSVEGPVFVTWGLNH